MSESQPDPVSDPDILEYPAMAFNALVARHGLAYVLKDIAHEYEMTFSCKSAASESILNALKDAAKHAAEDTRE